MLERTTRIGSESLARAIDRRSLLKRTGETAFLGLAALAAGHLVVAPAAAGTSPGSPPRTPSCAPPGPYCNLNGTNEPNGCHGASCLHHLPRGPVFHIRLYYFYQAGCW